MTVLAFRDGILAADRLVSDPSGRKTGEADKIGREGSYRWAWCGDNGNARKLLDWVRGGQIGDQPSFESGSVIVIHDDGEITIFGQGRSWPAPQARFHAWGCGSSYALGAMAMGAGAEQACLVACEFDNDCGPPIQRQD